MYCEVVKHNLPNSSQIPLLPIDFTLIPCCYHKMAFPRNSNKPLGPWRRYQHWSNSHIRGNTLWHSLFQISFCGETCCSIDFSFTFFHLSPSLFSLCFPSLSLLVCCSSVHLSGVQCGNPGQYVATSASPYDAWPTPLTLFIPHYTYAQALNLLYTSILFPPTYLHPSISLVLCLSF